LKTAWHIIKSETNKTKCNHGISSIEIVGKICTDHLDIAKAFNTYFTSLTDKIFVNSANTHSTPSNVCPLNYVKQVFFRPFPRINLTPTTAKEITEIVTSLTSTNSHGYDEIPTNVLKHSLPFIISPLIYICNKSLLKGIFPTQLKFSQIIPLLKKGKKNRNFKIQTNFFTHILF